MTGMSRYAFIVGFPGQVAVDTSKALCEIGDWRVTLLAEAAYLQEADRFARDTDGAVSVAEGAAGRIDFGLNGSDYLRLADEVTAILNLTMPDAPDLGASEEPAAQSAEAREVLELATVSKRLSHIIALSHVDVAGTFGGAFAEQDLELGQSFVVAAQKERCKAERIFRRFWNRLPITIARTGWIVGNGHGTCPLAQLLLTADEPASLPVKDMERPVAVSSVDAVVRVVSGLVGLPPISGGRTLHLLSHRSPSIEGLYEEVRNAADDLVPAGFDLATGARRALRRNDKGRFWSPRDFFRVNPLKAQISRIYSDRFLERNDLEMDRFDGEQVRDLAVHGVEEIVGFR